MIDKVYQFYVVGSALYKKEPRDVDIYGVMDDVFFKAVFDLKGEELSRHNFSELNKQKIALWRKENTGATRILQFIFPELIPIDFKFIPRSMLGEPYKAITLTRRPETWGIGFPNLANHAPPESSDVGGSDVGGSDVGGSNVGAPLKPHPN